MATAAGATLPAPEPVAVSGSISYLYSIALVGVKLRLAVLMAFS